ncbi:MAG: tyrosine-type recombinase/integrase, partial [Planctomycetota bacterium]|nr:tyrosine-type recombinase/integrase [Planctomycetota bacterium]
PDNFSQELRQANTAAGLPWHCLDFRHTFGTHLAQKGVSLYKIAELMGNSPDICRRHYAALCPEKMHDVVEFEQQPETPPNGPNDTTSAVVRHLLEKIEQLENDRQARMPRLRIAQ